MFQFVYHMMNEQSPVGLWEATKSALLLFQSLAILEVVHSAVGLVRSNPVLTLCQVFSRVFLVWPILYGLPDSRLSWGFPMLLTAWCITEVIRYFFYFLGILGPVPHILVYLRYTLFLGLYPLGVAGELLCCYSVLPLAGSFSLALPNAANFAFNFHTVLLCIMASYPPVFYQLFTHMLTQRKKILGAPAVKQD